MKKKLFFALGLSASLVVFNLTPTSPNEITLDQDTITFKKFLQDLCNAKSTGKLTPKDIALLIKKHYPTVIPIIQYDQELPLEIDALLKEIQGVNLHLANILYVFIQKLLHKKTAYEHALLEEFC